MFDERATVNEYVVEVNHQEFSHEWPEYVVHQSHEGARVIREPERHDQPLIESGARLERRLPFIARSDSYLVVAVSKIQLGKNFRSD